MRVIERHGDGRIATVYVAETGGGRIEFAESVQPPAPLSDKWVLIISCMIGCPVRCLMCDAGRRCAGLLTKEQMLEQIDCMVMSRFPDGCVPVKKFKVQLTRMGEPAFNTAVLDVLEELPSRYRAPGLIPSVSTVAPLHCQKFLEKLADIKRRLYSGGRFQLQFSIHTTDAARRDELIPIRKLSFTELAEFGGSFFEPGDRKITLNFIVMNGYPIDPSLLRRTFDPSCFLIKLTPLNPTRMAGKNALSTALNPNDETSVAGLVSNMRSCGFETLVSIGALEENAIGSNCGQYVSA